jgi:HEAT repeat protein
MANDKDVLGRRWAMNELEIKAANPVDRERIVAALVTSAEKDPFWRVRRAALSVIANIYSPDPAPGQDRPAFKLDGPVEAAVVRLAKDPKSLIRADAIELLGETQDKKYADLYLASLSDQSYAVIDQAALGLGRTRDPRGLDALTKLTSTKSWKGRVLVAGLMGLGELEDKRAFNTVYKIATDTSLSRAVRTNALSALGATGKGDPRAFPVIFEEFKKATAATNFQGMINGMQAFIKIADPRGQEAFDLLKVKFKDQPGALNFIAGFETRFKSAIGK